MPELPETETIKNDLRAEVVGRKITAVSLTDPSVLARNSFGESLERAAAGREIRQVSRRGKYVILELDSPARVVFHLAITGQLVLMPPGGEDLPYLRASFQLDDGRKLQFGDSRKFGRILLLDPDAIEELSRRLGPEPLSPEFTEELFYNRIKQRRGNLKALLLDQEFLAGLGNIYVDEVLFTARIHPLRRVESLSDEEIHSLHDAIRSNLAAGVEHRGTTFSDYRDAYGRKGTHQNYLQVFLRTKKPCPACGTPIKKMTVAGRGTHYCPVCQPEPDEGQGPRGRGQGE